MAETIICLATLILGPALLCWCDRNTREMLRYVRRVSDPNPELRIERNDPVLGYLPCLIVPQAF